MSQHAYHFTCFGGEQKQYLDEGPVREYFGFVFRQWSRIRVLRSESHNSPDKQRSLHSLPKVDRTKTVTDT